MSVDELKQLIETQQLEFQAMREAYQADLKHAQDQALQANQQLEVAVAAGGAAAGADPVELGSIAVRLPTFWSSSPELWFAQVEANFDNRNPKITSDTSKYNHVLQALPLEVLEDCEHAVQAQGQDRYGKLKTALIKIYGKTLAEKNAELLALSSKPGGLGDKKPSSIMMKIRTLSGSSYDALERALFLNQMPTAVRTALASSKAVSNDELAAEADAVMEEFKLSNLRAGVPHAVATVEVDAATIRNQRYGRPFPSGRPQSDALCYLHRKFGASAYACRSSNCPMKDKIAKPPTVFQGNGRAGR